MTQSECSPGWTRETMYYLGKDCDQSLQMIISLRAILVFASLLVLLVAIIQFIRLVLGIYNLRKKYGSHRSQYISSLPLWIHFWSIGALTFLFIDVCVRISNNQFVYSSCTTLGLAARIVGFDIPFICFVCTVASFYTMMGQVRSAGDTHLRKQTTRLTNIVLVSGAVVTAVFLIIKEFFGTCGQITEELYETQTLLVSSVLMILGLVIFWYARAFAKTLETFAPHSPGRQALVRHLRHGAIAPLITGTIQSLGLALIATTSQPKEAYWICMWLLMVIRISLMLNAVRLAIQHHKRGVSTPIPIFIISNTKSRRIQLTSNSTQSHEKKRMPTLILNRRASQP